MQKDYIMRIVEQFVEAILAIMKRRKAGEYKEARIQVQIATRSLLRTDLDLLLLYDNEQILDHFKNFSNQFETEKCVLGASLFYELALIEEAEKQFASAHRLKELCLHLYAIGLPKEVQFQKPQYFETLSSLVEELHNQPPSDEAASSLKVCEDLITNLSDKKQRRSKCQASQE